ncbi:hypothetical protein C3L33_12701, partial [Rhododendron williamsianum]
MTLQVYPATTTFIDSLHSSVSKLHVTSRLRFFRYSSSTPSNNQNLTSHSNPHRYPLGKSNSLRKTKGTRWVFYAYSSASSSWLDKWNETQKENKPKPPQPVLSYRNSGNASNLGPVRITCSAVSGGGGGGGSTMEKIVEKLKKFGYVDDLKERNEEGARRVIEKGSVEDIFYVEEGMLPNARGGFSEEPPLGEENLFGSNNKGAVRFPWEDVMEEEKEKKDSVRLKSRTSLAELTLPETELRRLKNLALRTKNKTKIGSGGVTQAVVDLIHEKWTSTEIVRLKIEGAPALNMKRMHEILERKTGGLVIWRSGTSISLYRDYSESSPIYDVHAPRGDSGSTLEEKKSTELSQEVEYEYEDEVDKLLESLGPRYTDWPGDDPLPVDADLLPGIVPGYEPPFRILPYGVRSTLSVKDATSLRRLARKQAAPGLASAMIKLWERSKIAKVALKRGVQLTTSERMAEEIKGKEFFVTEVAEALLEKERLAKTLQDEEEQARLRATAMVIPKVEINDEFRTAGSLEETLDASARWGKTMDNRDKVKVMREAEMLKHANLVRKLESKLAFVMENMHLHWKYRELVKIIVNAKSFDQDYQRPAFLRPKNLLTKRKALARSIEIQRREALLNHISTLETRVGNLRAEIDQIGIVRDSGDEELYDKLDSTYSTEDEDNE